MIQLHIRNFFKASIFISILVISFFYVSSNISDTSAGAQSKDTKLNYKDSLFIGDSITAGQYLSSPLKAYTYDLLKNSNGSLIMGYLGYGVEDMLDDHNPVNLVSKNDLIVIELGTNDYYRLNPTSLYRFEYLYNKLLSGLFSADPKGKFVCISTWNPHPNKLNNLGLKSVQYDGIIKASCNALGGSFIDISDIARNKMNWGKDPMPHPNEYANQEIAQKIISNIQLINIL